MSLFRRARTLGREVGAPSTPRLPRRRNAGLLRRERRALLAARERRVRDLGGLAAEMYGFGAWRSDLIEERCAEIAGIDARVADIEALLARRPPPARCSCGAQLREGAQFCNRCGAVVAAPAVQEG